MGRKLKPIDASLVEFVCDECHQGVYRYDDEAPILQSSPKQYPHTCSHCGHQTYFTLIYPLVEFNRREFMMRMP